MKKFIAFLVMAGAVTFCYFRLRDRWIGEAPQSNIPAVQQINRAKPDPPEQAEKLLQMGERYLEQEDTIQAERAFRQALELAPDTYSAKRCAFRLAEVHADRKEAEPAQEMLAKAEGVVSEAEKQRLEQKLAELLKPVRPDRTYTIRKGDNLSTIAKQFDTRPEILRLANNLKSDLIRVGDQLTVSYAYPRILISKGELKLYLFFKDKVVKRFPVGIGKEDLTPAGTFRISDRIQDPRWYSDEGVIPFGDPRNILGTRWLTLSQNGRHTGLGIHGTTEPESVPGRCSQGCIRMLNKDVEELCNLVPVGTLVEIKE
jgi:lipoprotein-anchoring transpeptidase ErfK/SrfK